jgi:hypothetical protein
MLSAYRHRVDKSSQSVILMSSEPLLVWWRRAVQVLVELGVLSPAEVSAAIATHIPSVRMGVAGLTELRLTGVLELGVSPMLLLDSVKRYRAALTAGPRI